MNVLGLILNLLIPGVGSFVVGKPGQGIAQILIWGVGLLLWLTVIGAIIGFPLMLGAWIWGIITAVGSKEQTPLTGNVVQQTGSGHVAHTQPRDDDT